MENEKKKFIIYSYYDSEKAQKIENYLKEMGLKNIFKLTTDNLNKDFILKNVSSEDFLIFLVSSNVSDSYSLDPYSDILQNKMKMRDITSIYVSIQEGTFPEKFKFNIIIDFSNDFKKIASELYKTIIYLEAIDFSVLNAKKFEELVGDVLKCIGFNNVQYEPMINYKLNKNSCEESNADYGKYPDLSKNYIPDFLAEYEFIDPFGFKNRLYWIVEVKFYRNNRLNLKTINTLRDYFFGLPEKYKAVVFTNTQITSVSREYIDEVKNNSRVEIKVIEGPELKKILLKHPDLINKYFCPREDKL